MVKKQKPDFSQPKPLIDKEAEKQRLDEEHKNKTYSNCPLVVIAGRPNVGKSTLFNCFMKQKIAITDPTPGVTRDPVEDTAFIAGQPVHLVDTGGYKLERDDVFNDAAPAELYVDRSRDTSDLA